MQGQGSSPQTSKASSHGPPIAPLNPQLISLMPARFGGHVSRSKPTLSTPQKKPSHPSTPSHTRPSLLLSATLLWASMLADRSICSVSSPSIPLKILQHYSTAFSAWSVISKVAKILSTSRHLLERCFAVTNIWRNWSN